MYKRRRSYSSSSTCFSIQTLDLLETSECGQGGQRKKRHQIPLPDVRWTCKIPCFKSCRLGKRLEKGGAHKSLSDQDEDLENNCRKSPLEYKVVVIGSIPNPMMTTIKILSSPPASAPLMRGSKNDD